MDEPRTQEAERAAASGLAEQARAQGRRKLLSRQDGAPGVWMGLGMMGMVGWSVALPTLLGAGLGAWLDAHRTGNHSWTLALLVAGLVLGCLNAWRWVESQDKAMHPRPEREDA